MEKLALLDPPAHPALLEREENKDSLVLQVSRVYLDLLVPLEREASLETRVFLERVGLLVLPDPEENVVSPEREELPALRVCRDLEVCLELPEPTGPREPSDLVVLLELRDPPACRVCLEREEVLAFPDPKETEVILERKDPKVLPAKMVVEV